MPFDLINQTFATLTLLGLIGLGVFFIIWIFSSKFHFKFFEKILSFVGNNWIILSLTIVLFATFSSLFYSQVVQLIPCSLCWYQRIFLFPQAFLLGMNFVNRKKQVLDSCLLLTFVGMSIAIYHIFVQLGFGLPTPCSINEVADCAVQPFTYYGFITIPVMSFIAFASLFTILCIAKKRKAQ